MTVARRSTQGPVREPRRSARQGSRDQDQRRRRRRHDDRDRARAGDGPRGTAQRRGGREPARAQARHRRRRRGVSDKLLETAREVDEQQEIAHVATISAQDAEIGELIAEAFGKVGKDGVITVEEAPTMGLELEFTEGMQFDKGYISPYFVTDPERMEAVLDDAYILLHAGQDLLDGRFAAAAGEDHPDREAVADHRRGRRGRGAVHPGRQQDPRHAHRGAVKAPGLR